MMPYCTSCGSPIPEGQGKSCSMCYGDIAHGHDGYYDDWAKEQLEIEEQKMTHDYKSALECLGVAQKFDDFKLLYAHKETIRSSLQLAREVEQHKAEKEAMRRVLDGSRVLIDDLRKERDELAEYVYKVGNGKHPVIAKYYELAKKVNDENGNG